MMRKRLQTIVQALRISVLCFLASCGTHAPSISEAWEPAELNDDLVYRIQKSIYCELRKAVNEHASVGTLGRKGETVQIPDDWGAQLTLYLTGDETGSVSPNLSYNKIFRNAIVPNSSPFGQSFNLPLAATLSSQAVRKDTYYSFFLVKGLKEPINTGGDTSCAEYSLTDPKDSKLYPLRRNGSSYFLSGDIGIGRWLKGALTATTAIPSSLPGSVGKKTDVLQYDIKFIVLSTASVNPTLKLVSFFVGGAVPLFSINRTRTHELLLTLGPIDTTGGRVEPSQQAQGVHLSGEIYSAVSSGFRSVVNALP